VIGLLTVNSINVYYGELQALHDVTLTVKEGEFLTLIGSNGSGKSTLLKTIMGLLTPKTGSVYYNDIRLDGLPAYEITDHRICLVPENKLNFPNINVEENLLMGAYPKRCRKSIKENLDKVYQYFPRLFERKKQLSKTLSGGELQMLIIARALMSEPKVMMVDELSLGLSPKLTLESFALLARLHKENDLTIILAEQNVFNALEIADRGIVIKNGRVAMEGCCKDLLCSSQIKEQYLGM
jgi:branched-chain amino acid transport system ATP-binding protein